MDHKNENLQKSLYSILNTSGIILRTIGNSVGIKKLTFLDVLFLKDHCGSSKENWIEMRQDPGNRKAGERQ